MARFELDVDPEKIRSAARRMKAMSREAGSRGEKVSAAPNLIGEAWTGRAARSVKQEMRGMGARLTAFAQDLADTRRAVVTLAERYEEALGEIATLNKQWETADHDYDAAVEQADEDHAERTADSFVPTPPELDLTRLSALSDATEARDAERKRLERKFDRLRDEVRRDTRRCASTLAQRVPLPVAPDALELYRDFGVHGVAVRRDDFNADMPLSREVDLAAIEAIESRDGDERVESPLSGWDSLGAGIEWRNLRLDEQQKILAVQAVQLRETAALVESTDGYRAAVLRGQADGMESRSKFMATRFVRGVPGLGHAVTAAGVGHEIIKGEPVGKTLFVGGSSALAGAGAVALASGPIGWGAIAAVGAGVLVGVGVSYVAEWMWDTEVGKDIREGTKDVAAAIGNGAKSAWKSVFG